MVNNKIDKISRVLLNDYKKIKLSKGRTKESQRNIINSFYTRKIIFKNKKNTLEALCLDLENSYYLLITNAKDIDLTSVYNISYRSFRNLIQHYLRSNSYFVFHNKLNNNILIIINKEPYNE